MIIVLLIFKQLKIQESYLIYSKDSLTQKLIYSEKHFSSIENQTKLVWNKYKIYGTALSTLNTFWTGFQMEINIKHYTFRVANPDLEPEKRIKSYEYNVDYLL